MGVRRELCVVAESTIFLSVASVSIRFRTSAAPDFTSRSSYFFVHPQSTLECNYTTSCSPSPRRRSLAQVIRGCPRPPRPQSVPGHDVFLADELSERDEAIGDQFRVLDEVGGGADNTRNQDFPEGTFHVAPDFVFIVRGGRSRPRSITPA